MGYGVRSYMAGKESLAHRVADQDAALAAQKDYLDKIAQRDAWNQELQNKLTALDTEKTHALTQALATNSALRSDLAVAQRMHLKGTSCPAGTAAGGQTGAAGSLGDDPGIELSAETRFAVFDLRAGLISDEAKLEYLQRYIRQLGLSPPSP